jgi:hypothetical protein
MVQLTVLLVELGAVILLLVEADQVVDTPKGCNSGVRYLLRSLSSTEDTDIGLLVMLDLLEGVP